MDSNSLRVFQDIDDLFDSIDNAVIFAWVNELARVKPLFQKLYEAEEKRRGYHKVYQTRKKLTLAAVTRLLDPDELKRIQKEAEERVVEGGLEDV